MRIKQTMKSLGIISLTAMIIPLILGPTTSVYAQEKSTTESSATEVQQSIEQLKDPLSILSKLTSDTKENSISEEVQENTDDSSSEKESTKETTAEEAKLTEQDPKENNTAEETEQTTDEAMSPKNLRAKPSAKAIVSGNWLYDSYNHYGIIYAWLRAYVGPATTAIIIPSEIDGLGTMAGNDFFRSLAATNITDIAVQPATGGHLFNVQSLELGFYGNTKIVNVDLSNAYIGGSAAISMKAAFEGCTNLQYVRLPNTSLVSVINVVDTSNMFASCVKLTNLDLSKFYTQNVTNMENMFANCTSLTSIDVSNFNTLNVSNMGGMFQGCSNLSGLDLSKFRTDNVVTMAAMFQNCVNLTNINTSNWITGKVGTMHKMFMNCYNLPQLYISHFDTTQVFDMSGMFMNCQKLTSATFSFTTGTQNVINMADMYNGCSSLTSLDVSHMNTQKVQNMYAMFANCPSLVTLKLNGPSFNTQNVTDMSFMFAGNTALTNLDVSHFNTGKVQNMAYMFGNNQSLTHLNVTSFNTTNVTNMAAMFLGTGKIKNLNLTSFNTHIVSNMTDMFKTGIQQELFVLSNDAKILNHGYHLDNRVPPEILLQANYGQFSDSSTSKNFFTRCALTPAQATVSEVKNFMSGNTPTRTNRTFEGWTLVSGIDVNATGTFTDLFGTIYKAKWNSFGLAQVPTAKTFSGNLNKGTITIPSSGTTNEVGVLDESSDTKGWTLTAQLVWSGTAPNSTTTLRTVSTGTTNEITPTGSIGAAPAGLVTTGANLSISTTPGTVLKGNDSVQQFEGTYVTDLGAISLEIADGSGVIAQSYSGNILWDLAIAP